MDGWRFDEREGPFLQNFFLVLLHVISASSLPGVYQEHIAVCSNIQREKRTGCLWLFDGSGGIAHVIIYLHVL